MKMLTPIFRLVSFCALTLATPIFAQQRLPVKHINIGIHVIQAEVATTEGQRQQGLMHRKKMAQNEGMLFVFEQPQPYCMWMKNTLIPLSVAFVDSKGTIINIEEMHPQTEKNHCASRPALYALEMNAHWFKHKNIQPGSQINLF